MKIVGTALVWVGVIGLLKGIGIVQVVDWSIVWPVIIIVIGSAVKHVRHGMMCGMGGKCGACGTGGDHKCEGADCSVCKK